MNDDQYNAKYKEYHDTYHPDEEDFTMKYVKANTVEELKDIIEKIVKYQLDHMFEDISFSNILEHLGYDVATNEEIKIVI